MQGPSHRLVRAWQERLHHAVTYVLVVLTLLSTIIKIASTVQHVNYRPGRKLNQCTCHAGRQYLGSNTWRPRGALGEAIFFESGWLQIEMRESIGCAISCSCAVHHFLHVCINFFSSVLQLLGMLT